MQRFIRVVDTQLRYGFSWCLIASCLSMRGVVLGCALWRCAVWSGEVLYCAVSVVVQFGWLWYGVVWCGEVWCAVWVVVV